MCTEVTSLPAATQRRVRVHRLRTCIEVIAADAFANVTKTSSRQNRIAIKLLSLLSTSPREATEPQALAAIRAAQRAYTCSSDVLHGRVSQVNLHEVTVTEWEAALSNLLRIWPSMQELAVCPDCRTPVKLPA